MDPATFERKVKTENYIFPVEEMVHPVIIAVRNWEMYGHATPVGGDPWNDSNITTQGEN